MESNAAMNFSGMGGGIIMSLISFSIVFLVCAGLMALMMSLKYIVRVFDAKGNQGQSNEIPSAEKPTAGGSCLAQKTPDDENELVAVITAAVTAAHGSVRVMDIRPSSASLAPPSTVFSAWKMASRIENNKGI